MKKGFKKKKNIKKKIFSVVVNVSATYNNTIVTIADLLGQVIAWCSTGCINVSNSIRNTPYIALRVGKIAAEKVMKMGAEEAFVVVKGIGPGKEAAVRGIEVAGLSVKGIKDKTAVPFNGCREKKPKKS